MVMTTSRLALAALWISLGIHLWAQTDPAVVPTQWTWAYAEFQVDPTGPADSPWRITLPQLLVKGWEQPEKHVLTEPEKTAWRGKNLAHQRLEIQKQLDQKALDRSRLLLGPKVKPAEVTAAEKAIADLIGAESSIVYTAGHPTNETTISYLWAEGGTEKNLILLDEEDHNSIVLGAQFSGARILMFKHNDWHHLEKLLH
jgi:hypothetical protein